MCGSTTCIAYTVVVRIEWVVKLVFMINVTHAQTERQTQGLHKQTRQVHPQTIRLINTLFHALPCILLLVPPQHSLAPCHDTLVQSDLSPFYAI